MRRHHTGSGWLKVMGVALATGMLVRGSAVLSQDTFDSPPIRYSQTISSDPIAILQGRLNAGEVTLERDPMYGYLPSLLDALDVPRQSQVLVFSKTSLQIHKISPANPRAIFFNDSVYIGYVPGSEILELAASDPHIGAVFYTLDSNAVDPEVDEAESVHEPAEADLPAWRLVRDRGNCLSCHATTRTENVPGYLVRSIYPDRSGRPRTGASSYTTDYRSPWKQRWGGWYVTGSHGGMRHMGNVFATDRTDPHKLDFESGANWTALPPRVTPDLHLLPSSDLVALLVLEHQIRVHNLMTRANYETRQAVALDEAMNQALGRPADYRSDSTKRRIASAANALVDAILMADEPRLEAPVSGTGGFREIFEARGPTTSSGQSLRQLDLNERLFRYPLSFLVYSKEFHSLPTEAMGFVRARLTDELMDSPSNHLSRGLVPHSLRSEIRTILRETLPNDFISLAD